jgi:hypothetical protein
LALGAMIPPATTAIAARPRKIKISEAGRWVVEGDIELLLPAMLFGRADKRVQISGRRG